MGAGAIQDGGRADRGGNSGAQLRRDGGGSICGECREGGREEDPKHGERECVSRGRGERESTECFFTGVRL